MKHLIIFYDAPCVMCNFWVQKLAKWDKNDPRGKRPSPEQSAAATDVGTIMKGCDGTDYIVKENTKGIHRWVKHKP